MSEFTVCRTLDTHPALRYCLLLDDTRIAGGKPDYRGDNILISWRTKATYGSVDALMAENAKLRKLVDYMTPIALYSASEREREEMRELGVEVDG